MFLSLLSINFPDLSQKDSSLEKNGHVINPLTIGAILPKMHFFLIVKIFSLEMDQIKKAFATWQHSFPSTSTTFYNIFAQAYAGVDGLKKHKGQLSDSPLIINTEFINITMQIIL